MIMIMIIIVIIGLALSEILNLVLFSYAVYAKRL